jgi:hypothetical protein
MRGEPKGKPKFPPTVKEQETIVTLAASGLSQTKIAQTVGRSRHMIKNVLADPAVQQAVVDERTQLATLYRSKARDVLAAISDSDISGATLQQKCISTGILLDKSLLLAGELPSLDVHVLLEIAAIVRGDRPAPPPEIPALPEGPK